MYTLGFTLPAVKELRLLTSMPLFAGQPVLPGETLLHLSVGFAPKICQKDCH